MPENRIVELFRPQKECVDWDDEYENCHLQLLQRAKQASRQSAVATESLVRHKLETLKWEFYRSDLTNRVIRELQGRLFAPASALPTLAKRLNDIIDITNELFPGAISIENSTDPEFPDTVYVVFRVKARSRFADLDKLIDQENLWHRRVRKIAPDSRHLLRLTIE